jgi:hypothetical protein
VADRDDGRWAVKKEQRAESKCQLEQEVVRERDRGVNSRFFEIEI